MRISPERWAQLEPHFDRLVDLDAAAREAELDRLATGDPALADDLRELLRKSEGSGRMEHLGVEAADLISAAGADAAGDDDLTERRVGHYRLVRAIGRGGMSVVYLAEREDGTFDQQVAVKVMHWTGGARGIERFRLEQQTLARLDHPAITRIFDSGVTEDGLPYFVMEYVDGVPVTDAAAERGLSVRERVRLFVRLCDAVHSAHRALVVHRDLKPDNVLMMHDGNVKVLDFGIAKWLDEDGGEGAAGLTRHGEGLLTPQYASPEQFEEHPVTTASDVYALGLLLYEMLAGRPPYELKGKSITEQRRLVCEEAPERLSLRADDPETRRELRGDLEIICAKALQKEPERRYDSAAAMADDLRRHLDGQPVDAAPDSATYRASRFVKRHRVPVTIGALAALGLIAAAITTAWQAGIASRERDVARVEAARSQKVVDFLVGALEQSNPFIDDGGTVTVREFLERSADRIDTDLADEPDVRRLMYGTMAQVFANTGEPRRGQAMADRAIHLADSLYGPRSLEAATARYQKAKNLSQSNIDSTIALRLDAIAAIEDMEHPEARLMLANVLEDYASNLSELTQYDSALVVHRRALSIREAVYDKPHADLARSHHYIATCLSGLKDPTAGAAFAEAARLWEATIGANKPNYAATLNNWALWLDLSNRPDSAEVLYNQALAIERETLGPRSASVAMRLNNLGRLTLHRGRVDAAERHLTEAVDILREHEGSELPIAAAVTNLGLAAYLSGDYATAEARYREGRALFEKRFGHDHAYVAIADSYIGRALWMQGERARAERRLQRALGVLEQHLPGMASRVVAVRTWLGRMWMEQDAARAEPPLRSAVEMAYEHLPHHSAERGEAEVALGLCLMQRGAREEGGMRLRSGYESLVAAHGNAHPMTQWAQASLASAATL